jgi:carbon-monoxide dehydrogenase medium subunit
MMDYRYINPESLEEGLRILAQSGEKIRVLAGGTDLLVRIMDGKEYPDTLLDISNMNLNYIREGDGCILTGAATPLQAIADYWAPGEEPFCILNRAAVEIGGAQTRHMGTVGGNICTGISSADMAVPLLALEADLRIDSLGRSRYVPADKFFVAPRKTEVKSNEILAEIVLKQPDRCSGLWRSAYIKLGRRKAMRLSVVSIGVVANIDPQSLIINKIRIAMGTVAPVPVRLYNTESVLEGKVFGDTLIEEAVQALEKEIKPRTSPRATKEYRLQVARVLLKRAVYQCISIL